MRRVGSNTPVFRYLVVSAQIHHIRQRMMVVAWPTGITKRALLKCASTQIPQIMRIAQAQVMELRTKCDSGMRTHPELHEIICVVHQVIKRETGVGTGCRKYLEKGFMTSIRRIAVAAAIEMAHTQPRFNQRQFCLTSSFKQNR